MSAPEASPQHTPGHYTCGTCGWSGLVNGRPRCLPCGARRSAEWRRRNPEHKKKLKKAYLARKGPEYAAQRKRIKRTNNPETAAEAWRRRVDWLKTGDVTHSDLRKTFAVADGKCYYCAVSVSPRFNPKDPRGFDHIVPRISGGEHIRSNVVVSCGPCNARKSDKQVAS